MANTWRNNGNRDFILLGSKITEDGDWSHEIKRCLLLGRKAMTNLDSVLKSRDITFCQHLAMGSIKDRNGIDLTEAEDIKKRWQEYPEELYKKDLQTRIITMV